MSVIVKLLSKFDDSGIKKAQGGFKGLGKVIAAAGIGLGISQLTDAAKAASADAKSQLLLATQLKRSTDATDAQVAANESYLQTLSNQLGILDDELRPAMSRFARVTGDVQKAQELLQITLDASAGSGLSQEKVSKAVAQAYKGNTAALKRMFPELKNSKDVLGDLAAEFEGFAAKKADPFAKFNVSMDNFKEQIGSFILPMLTEMMRLLSLPYVKEFGLLILTVVAATKAWTVATTALAVVQGILAGVTWTLAGALTAIGWTLIVAAIVAVIAGITYLATQTTFFQDTWTNMVAAFKIGIDWIVGAWGNVQSAFTTAFEFIGNAFKGYVNFWIGMFEGFINGISNGINGMLGGLNQVLDGVKAASFGSINLHVNKIPMVKLPKLAKGGIVMPTPGGTNVTVGEGGRPEAIIPLSSRSGLGSTVNIYVQSADPRAVVDAVSKYVKGNGRLPTAWGI
jgi:hypothetical protein